MTTYTLKGKPPHADIVFTVEDLQPIPQKRNFSFEELVSHTNYAHYHPCYQNFDADYKKLYSNEAHKGTDFFQIRNTGVVVIPGGFIYPTILTPAAVRCLQ